MTADKHSMQTSEIQVTDSDLSELIKAATKDSHVRAENTELMLAFQRGNISLPQYKLLLCSLYTIYEALEEELDRNASHNSIAPIYFPQELARLEALKQDLEHFYGQDWKKHVLVPAATLRYAQRLREVGRDNPAYLVAHAYTRYLGDLSGGQILGRITQKSLGLKDRQGLAFFSFPGVSSPNLFKQLYRSRMNSIELTEEQMRGMLQEAVTSFEFNIQVFDELQKLLSISDQNELRHRNKSQHPSAPHDMVKQSSAITTPVASGSQILRMLLGVCLALALSIGLYAF